MFKGNLFQLTDETLVKTFIFKYYTS